MMVSLKLSSFPVSDATFRPTKALWLQDKQSVTSLIDVSASLQVPDDAEPPSLTLLGLAKAAASSPEPPVLLNLQSSGRYLEARSSPQRTVGRKDAPSEDDAGTEEAGSVIATLSVSVLSFGKWTIRFPAGSAHASHSIEMKPVDFGSRAMVFTQDKVPYFWDMWSGPWGETETGIAGTWTGRRVCELWKVVDGERVLVARFLGRRARDREGTLVIDESGVDIVVAGITCAALLKRVDTFEVLGIPGEYDGAAAKRADSKSPVS